MSGVAVLTVFHFVSLCLSRLANCRKGFIEALFSCTIFGTGSFGLDSVCCVLWTLCCHGEQHGVHATPQKAINMKFVAYVCSVLAIGCFNCACVAMATGSVLIVALSLWL